MQRLLPALFVLTLVALTGCSETGLTGTTTPEEPPVEDAPVPVTPVVHGDPPDWDPKPRPECEPLDLSAGGVDINADCGGGSAPGSFPMVVERVLGGSARTIAQPAVGSLTDDDGDGDVDGDDVPDIVMVSDRNEVIVISGDGSGEHWSYAGSGMMWNLQPAIGDVDNDSDNDVVAIVGTAGTTPFDTTLMAFEGQTGEILWATVVDGLGFNHLHSGISLGDMDSDGVLEIAYGNAIFDGATGDLISQTAGVGLGSPSCEYAGTPTRTVQSVLADLDQDGEDELVVGNAASDRSGRILWRSGEADGAPAIANFDADPEAEILSVYNHNFCRPGSEVRLHDHDGSLLWKVGYSSSSPVFGVSVPVIADFDGDGEVEVFHALSDAMATRGARVEYILLDTDGTEIWSAAPTVTHDRPGAPPAAIDIDQDGAYEIVVQEYDKLRLLDGLTGATVSTLDVPLSLGYRAPTIADIDQDGQAEIIVARFEAIDPTLGGLAVIGGAREDWPPTQQVWAEHGHRSARRDADGMLLTGPRDWSEHNSFRAAWHPRSLLPDPTLELIDSCEVECDRDRVMLSWRAANAGAVELPAGGEVVAWTGDPEAPVELSRTPITDTLAPGQTTEGVLLELDATAVVNGTVHLSFESTAASCDEALHEIVVTDLCDGDPDGE